MCKFVSVCTFQVKEFLDLIRFSKDLTVSKILRTNTLELIEEYFILDPDDFFSYFTNDKDKCSHSSVYAQLLVNTCP